MKSIVPLKFLTISAFVGLVTAKYKFSEKKCITPSGKQIGRCKYLEECPALLHLDNGHFRTPEQDRLLRQSISLCMSNSKRKVCCPKAQTPEIRFAELKEVPPLPISNPSSRLLGTTTTTTTTTKMSFSTCGISPLQTKIVGGDATEYNEYPWLALLEFTNRIIDLCSASVISRRFLLTAAHCLRTSLGLPINVRLAEYNLTTDPVDTVVVNGGGTVNITIVTMPIKWCRAHPNYNSKNYIHDIAIIKTRDEIQYTDYIKPICLPPIDYREKVFTSKTTFMVAGWGLINATQLSDVKRHVKLPYAECAKPNNGQICAGGERDKDSCQGDSGGPLMYRDNGHFVAVGIVSAGKSCGVVGNTGIYTYVYEYLGWIGDMLKK